MVISPCPILTGTCHVPVKAAKEEAAVKVVTQRHRFRFGYEHPEPESGSRAAALPSEVLRIDTSYWVLPADKHMPFANYVRQGENMILKKERNCYR